MLRMYPNIKNHQSFTRPTLCTVRYVSMYCSVCLYINKYVYMYVYMYIYIYIYLCMYMDLNRKGKVQYICM